MNCHEQDNKQSSIFRSKSAVVFYVLFALLALSLIWPPLVAFRQAFLMYFNVIWWATLIGLLLGGVVDHFVPHDYVSHLFQSGRKRSILYAVSAGFLMSACSHGILALSIQLHKKGASNPSVISFLLASPWANIPLTIILFGFFGAKAFFLIGAAIVIAIVTGLIFQFLESKNWIETNAYTTERAEGFSLRKDLLARLAKATYSASKFRADLLGIWKGSVALADMVLWWMVIGLILASFAAAYVPGDWFLRYMGPTLPGLGVTLAFATVLEVCSEGTAPLAFEIFRQTGAFGNALVFLMAGVATDYTEIGLLWSNVGKRTAVWLPIIAVPQILLLGYFANQLF